MMIGRGANFFSVTVRTVTNDAVLQGARTHGQRAAVSRPRAGFRSVAGAVAALGLLPALPAIAGAQNPVSRDEAVQAAVNAGTRLAIARSDTMVAFAGLAAARAWQNPTLSATYSKSVPTYHYIVDLPFDLPGMRSARIGSARSARLAAQYRYTFERAGAALDADTTYTRALAARERATLSHRTAKDADSLRRMVQVRRNAGDAAEMDLELAKVTVGQAENTAAADSLAYI